jgi:hypothetical protein
VAGFTWVYAWQTRRFDAPSYQLALPSPTVTTGRPTGVTGDPAVADAV